MDELSSGSAPASRPFIRDQHSAAAATSGLHAAQDTLSTNASLTSHSQHDRETMEKTVAMMVEVMLNTSGLPATDKAVLDFERGARASLVRMGHTGATEAQRAAVSEVMSSNGFADVDLSSLETETCRNDAPDGPDYSLQVVPSSDLCSAR